MGREDHRRAGVGNFVEFLDEDRAFGLEALDHVAVVHDLVAHIDGRAVSASACSTESIARTTPAQNPRGEQSSTLQRRLFGRIGRCSSGRHRQLSEMRFRAARPVKAGAP